MEQNYEVKVVIPEIDRRNQFIAKVRKEMRNPHYDEINSHVSKIKQWEEAERERVAKLNHVKNDPTGAKPSRIYKEVKQRDRELALAQKKEQEKRKEAVMMKQSYSNEVRSKYKPKVDPEKQKQMELLALDVDRERAKAMRQRGDEMMKNHAKEYLHMGMKEVVGDDPEVLKKARNKKPPEEPKAAKPINYLNDLKAQRKPKKKLNIKLVSPEELADRAKAKEREAQEKEAILLEETTEGGAMDVDTAAQVSEMYIDVIKTKLELLASPQLFT